MFFSANPDIVANFKACTPEFEAIVRNWASFKSEEQVLTFFQLLNEFKCQLDHVPCHIRLCPLKDKPRILLAKNNWGYTKFRYALWSNILHETPLWTYEDQAMQERAKKLEKILRSM